MTPKNGENFIFSIADGSEKLCGRDHGLRNSTSLGDQPVRSEEPSRDLCCIREEFGEEIFCRRVRNPCSNIPDRRWNSPIVWRKSGYPNITTSIRDQLERSDLKKNQSERGEECRDDLPGESDRSQPIGTMTNGREARNDFRSIEGNHIYRHHVEPSAKLPQEESFLIPLRYFHVVTRTNTTLDVLQECPDDYWNIGGDLNLSEPWTGFTPFTISIEKPRDGYMCSEEQLTNVQATTRPDFSWSDMWFGKLNAAQRTEKQQWAVEKPKLDNARMLRSIYLIDPEDVDLKETIKNARKKLELPIKAAMTWKLKTYTSTGRPAADPTSDKSKHACIVEAHESMRSDWEELCRRIMKIAREYSLQSTA